MKRLLSLILFLATIGVVTWMLRPSPEAAPGLDKDAVEDVQRWRQSLVDEHPQVVLLGNSMLGHGVNAIHFAMRTGLPTVKMWDGGVASAWRYLMLKNVIAPSPGKPEVVVIFFKDQYLTEPAFRVDGNYKARLDALRQPSEPLLDELAYGKERRDPLANLVSECWPLDRQRAVVKPTVEDWIKKQVGYGLHEKGKEAVNAAIGRVFADNNLNTELFTKAQLEAMSTKTEDDRDFPTLIRNSFVPSDIKIAKAAGLRLIYVRIKRVQDAQAQEDGGTSYDNPYMKQYMIDLRAYLSSHDVPLFDFTTDIQLKVSDYADGDHLNEAGRLRFTAILAQALQRELPEPRSTQSPYADLSDLADPIVLSQPFKPRPPFGWIARLPEWKQYASNASDSYRSVLEVLEDGVPLGPANSFISEIASQGSGRFSHWLDAVYFSASDNSDPNTNGRVYSIRFRMPE